MVTTEENDYWLDENGNKYKLISYNFLPNKNGQYTLYGTLSNGIKLPLYELKTKFKKIDKNYIK